MLLSQAFSNLSDDISLRSKEIKCYEQFPDSYLFLVIACCDSGILRGLSWYYLVGIFEVWQLLDVILCYLWYLY